MAKILDKTFVSGQILTAAEMNEMVGAINKVATIPSEGDPAIIQPYEKDLKPGFVFLNNISQQFMIWNGHNWIILVNNSQTPTPAPSVTFDASPLLKAALASELGNHAVTVDFQEKLL